MFTFGLAGSGPGFDPLILLLLALAVEAYVGEARFLFKVVPHPRRLIGGAAATLERKLNREHRSQVDRAVRGALVAILAVVAALAAGWAVAWLTANVPFLWLVELVLLLALVGQRTLYVRARGVARTLAEEGLEPARRALVPLVRRDTAPLDAYGVGRAVAEAAATGFAKGAVAPVFWYTLFGFPGILVYAAVATLDEVIGHPTPRYRAFGFTAARLDDVLTLMPALLAGLMVCAAALFVPGAHPVRALKTLARDARKGPSIAAGWPQAALAGALDLALAGPRRYAERTVNRPWIGSGSARVSVADLSRVLYLYAVACLINTLCVAAIAAVRLGLPE